MAPFIPLRRLGATIVAGGSYVALRDPSVSANDRVGPALDAVWRKIADPLALVPSRTVQESALIGASSASPLDILVVGGGATGCGVVLDAATRGLRVGLVEREDFSSGTSSRSTKLIHGDCTCYDFCSDFTKCGRFAVFICRGFGLIGCFVDFARPRIICYVDHVV
ncbi:hypothetical protein F0562_025905 [Nyssa sinensis]|uniref:glycerol-3-phosphate dehydrogenase n=1 Tax=Nyssa sinensis TaxID=561372 RepID=A0A5J5B7L0_9ASTE|nr:hypothetical protein F0562_025905 [Nyssa sinensis]